MDPFRSLGSINPGKKAASLVEEFKNFAFKGNVIDLAVGVIIGAAFGKIITSLVENIVMPLISLLIPSSQSYTKWAFVIDDKVTPVKEIPYGKFLGDVVNFLIIAAALFIFISKFLGWLMRAKQVEAVAPPPLTKDQQLLVEIRDLLQKNVGTASSVSVKTGPS